MKITQDKYDEGRAMLEELDEAVSDRIADEMDRHLSDQLKNSDESLIELAFMADSLDTPASSDELTKLLELQKKIGLASEQWDEFAEDGNPDEYQHRLAALTAEIAQLRGELDQL